MTQNLFRAIVSNIPIYQSSNISVLQLLQSRAWLILSSIRLTSLFSTMNFLCEFDFFFQSRCWNGGNWSSYYMCLAQDVPLHYSFHIGWCSLTRMINLGKVRGSQSRQAELRLHLSLDASDFLTNLTFPILFVGICYLLINYVCI